MSAAVVGCICSVRQCHLHQFPAPAALVLYILSNSSSLTREKKLQIKRSREANNQEGSSEMQAKKRVLQHSAPSKALSSSAESTGVTTDRTVISSGGRVRRPAMQQQTGHIKPGGEPCATAWTGWQVCLGCTHALPCVSWAPRRAWVGWERGCRPIQECLHGGEGVANWDGGNVPIWMMTGVEMKCDRFVKKIQSIYFVFCKYVRPANFRRGRTRETV